MMERLMTTFTDDEKIHLFDEISELYFKQNFGCTSKADFETLIFSEYIEHCLRVGEPFDDYSLSKQLGITQSRIRSLKERKELKYPHNGFDWKAAFADSIKNAKYDETDHYVKFIVQDVNVMNEVRHFIEEKGWFDECSLNKKLLRLPLDCFTEICIDDDSLTNLFSEEVKKKIKAISKKDDSIISFIEDFSKEGFKAFLMSASKEIIKLVLPLLPFGGVAKTAFDLLEKVIGGK